MTLVLERWIWGELRPPHVVNLIMNAHNHFELMAAWNVHLRRSFKCKVLCSYCSYCCNVIVSPPQAPNNFHSWVADIVSALWIDRWWPHCTRLYSLPGCYSKRLSRMPWQHWSWISYHECCQAVLILRIYRQRREFSFVWSLGCNDNCFLLWKTWHK